MKTIKKLALTLLAVFTLACGVAGIMTAGTQKAYADGVLNANLNIGKDIALKLSAKIDGATSASATFTWKGNEADGTEKAENYVDTVVGENSGDGTFVFTYRGIGAQYLGKNVDVTVKYNTESDTEVVYTQKTLSVKDILTAYRNSSAIALGISPAAFEKIKTLSADILNYGAAAQEYTKVDTSVLVNAGLTSSDYTTVDFENLTGEVTQTGDLKFVMGVRFDCNIQPMAKFTSDKQNLTATINGTEAALEALGENQYKITYKDFNILSVNDTYTFEVFADKVSIGSATCSLAALAKNYNVAILRAAYTYGTAVSNYLEAKKTLVIEAESDYALVHKPDGSKLNVYKDNERNITILKDLTGFAGTSVTFGINAEADCKAELSATMRMMPWGFDLFKYVDIEINGEKLEYKTWLPKDENKEHDTDYKCDFATAQIAEITLKKGLNTIKFIENDVGGSSQFPDFDKIELVGESALNEHTHRCESVCPVCGKCTDKDCNDPLFCADKCECIYSIIEAESDCVTIKDAENPQWEGATKGGITDGKGRVKIDNENKGASFTFHITSDKEAEAMFFVYITPVKYDYYLHNHYLITLNSEAYSYETARILTPGGTAEYDGAWAKYFVKVKIGTIKLKARENTITFTANSTLGLIMDKIELISTSATVSGVAQTQAQ